MRHRSRRDDHTSGGRAALAFVGAIALAAISAAATALLVVAAGATGKDPGEYLVFGAGMTVACVAAAALIGYVEYVPGVAARVWNALLAVFGWNDRPVETGPVVLALDGAGAVVSTAGAVGMVLLYDWSRQEGWDSLVGFLLPPGASEAVYFVGASGVVVVGVTLLAAGWVAEGLSVTGDR